MRKHAMLIGAISTLLFTPAMANELSFLQDSAGDNFYQEGAALKRADGTLANDLCFPVSLAYSINYQKFVRKPNFENLQGPTPDAEDHQNGATPVQWIDYFKTSCHTDANGTTNTKVLKCIPEYYHKSGYMDPSIVVLNAGTDLTPSNIRKYLNAGYSGVIIIGWIQLGDWKFQGAHDLALVGYDYNDTWGEDQINLKIMDPAQSYRYKADKYSEYPFRLVNDVFKGNIPAAFEKSYLLTGFSYEPENIQGAGLQIIFFAPTKLNL